MSESSSVIPTMPFDDGKQMAIVGWCYVDPEFFDRVRRGVAPTDITELFLSRVYKALVDFWGRFKRLPTAQEVQGEAGFTHADVGVRKKMVEILGGLQKSRETFGIDVLRKDVENWMKAKLTLEAMNKFGRLWNASAKDVKKLEESLMVVPEFAPLIEATTFDDGAAGHRYTAGEDARAERADRVSEIVLPYGINFLDDSLGGMVQKDLVLVGAKTGAGKSQLVTAIATSVAQTGRTVDMFALEAEKHEIARRIKFSKLARAYEADASKKHVPGMIRYGSWRRNELAHVLDRYEDQVNDEIDKSLKTLRVKYREDGIFDNARLESEVKAVALSSDLVIIDHIHYVDLDGENENLELKKVIKTCRDLVLRNGIPVIIVAHLRKTQAFRSKAQVPNNDDFHGTSDLTKISTTCIMLGKGEPDLKQAAYLRPTLMRVTKSRIEGDLSWLVAKTQFDIRFNTYAPGYELSVPMKGDSEFQLLAQDRMPYWANHIWGKQVKQPE